MKFLLAQPGILRFQWELDVVITNIRSLDKVTPIVLLFTEHNVGVAAYLAKRYDGLEIHSYPDEREDKSYIPTVRPFLWWKYLTEDPSREQGTYFQIDSDVIFREMPDWSKFDLKGENCYASDCSGYIDHNYLSTRQQGDFIIEGFARILNISTDVIRDTPGGGAQWLITNPTAQLWWHIWKDSDLLNKFMEPIESDIQKWTAEMWAQLYNTVKFGKKVIILPELDFCRPTDDVKMWSMVKILHNAGAVGDVKIYFFKGKYVDSTPFDDDLSFVRTDKASIKYVDAIHEVKF